MADFTRLFDGGAAPSDSAIDDFMSRFAHMGLRDMVLGCLSDAEKKQVLCRAARCHVASFEAGRNFLERRNLLHRVDQDSANLFGALPAATKETMIAHAHIGECGQIVFTFPDIGLRIPLGRILLGTGEGALMTYEVRQLLMYQEGQPESLLEKFSAGLARVDEEYPDNEACHVWNDLIERCIDGNPIDQFSSDRTMLGVLAFALRALAGRVSARALHHEFPILRMLTNSAQAYFDAKDPKSCADSLIEMGHYHHRRSDLRIAAWANRIAASVLASAALDLWDVGRYAEARAHRKLAYEAYVTETVLSAGARESGATALPPMDGSPPPLMLGEDIPQSKFDELWADRESHIQPMQSSVPLSPTSPSIAPDGEDANSDASFADSESDSGSGGSDGIAATGIGNR